MAREKKGRAERRRAEREKARGADAPRIAGHAPSVRSTVRLRPRLIGVLIGAAAMTALVLAYRALAPDSSGAAAGAVAREGSPVWSPDGRRIAYYAEHDGQGEIHVMDADGSNDRRITDTPADEGYPAWSPDGRTITFDSDRDGNFEVYAMDADGGNVRRLTSHPASDVSASWSPDGSRIAFMSNRDGAAPSEFDVYLMPAAGGDPVRATRTGTAWFPVFSPEGSRLAFHVGRDVHVMPVVAGDSLTRLTTDPANGMYPSWSPDGKRLAFMSWRNGRTEIFTMNADGSDQRMVVSTPDGDAIDPRFSPDGSKIVFVHVQGGMRGAGPRTIRVANADGSDPHRLTGR